MFHKEGLNQVQTNRETSDLKREISDLQEKLLSVQNSESIRNSSHNQGQEINILQSFSNTNLI